MHVEVAGELYVEYKMVSRLSSRYHCLVTPCRDTILESTTVDTTQQVTEHQPVNERAISKKWNVRFIYIMVSQTFRVENTSATTSIVRDLAFR